VATIRTLLTAMNQYQLGNKEDARRLLGEADRIVRDQWPSSSERLRNWWMWRTQIHCEILQQEAKELILETK
jgi:hypothetical protein